jgi:4-nitrophenyl phosphatase
MSHRENSHAFLIDLDGTMYAGDLRIEHAEPFIGRLRELKLPFLFVTNNSSRTPEQVAAHLIRMGIAAKPEEIVTSSQATAHYIAVRKPGAKVFAIGEAGLRSALEGAGLELVEDQPDFVVQGIDRQFTYDKLARAVQFITDGAEYVLTNPDRLLPSDGRLVPGAGSIAASIQGALQIEPVVIGKPYEPIMRFALERLAFAEQVWAVGDNPATDILAGQAAGLRTALVQTGIAAGVNVEDLLERSGAAPDLICRNLESLLERLNLHTEGQASK